MRSTYIRDIELVQMAVFKLRETAERLATLAKEARTPRLHGLLAASSALLVRHAQELRVGLDTGSRAREPLPRSRERATARVRASA